ncbi:hypothetical protein [Arcobacter sp. CECT 8985]|uniref:hypothetical protein n=1 Tax=Arcobacter sp. CECT 8985 TaxID=1935424 RepID=UPI00100B5F74|nr:hypothetical protein [Arcobacter sp. CECT 8985]RXJ85602.1 hypothetical protein CRU93_10930 [Arcobacter sp. CECT 8985]
MYIHASAKILNEKKDIKEYRALLKQISSINLRRSSKFNILSVYGALLCMKNINTLGNSGIYISTENGPITDVCKVIDTVNEKDFIIMPFDFLNINVNNVSFYVAKALNFNGKNMVLMNETLGFEKTLQLAKFDLDTNDINEALIGAVDESVENIHNYCSYIENPLNKEIKEGSCWIYTNKQKENNLGKIEYIKEFYSVKELIENISFDTDSISLNSFAYLDKNLSEIIKNKNIVLSNIYYGCEGVLNILKIIKNKKDTIHIAKDKNNKVIVIKVLFED